MELYKKIRKLRNEYLKDLAKIIEIRSVLDKENEYPNIALKKVLKVFLDIAKKMGMKTYQEASGKYGFVEIGEGKEMIGIIGHLDVIPEVDIEAWNTPPFELVEKDGMLYGRGVQDDKGPIMISLYAMKVIFDSQIKLKRRIRLIVGTDEENLWRCVFAYKEDGQELPTFGFSPDSAFPGTYAEKASCVFEIEGKEKTNIFFKGGLTFNAVPEKAEIISENEQELKALEKYFLTKKWKYKKELTKFIAYGKSYHAKNPEKGDNAIYKIFKGLQNTSLETNLMKLFNQEWNLDVFASKIFGQKIVHKEIGPLTTNLGKVEIKDGKTFALLDVRVPYPEIDVKVVEKKLKDIVEKYNLFFSTREILPPVYLPKDGEIVKSYVASYQKITNDKISQPITSGGATYAKVMPKMIAFGPQMPHWKPTIHQPNEKFLLEDLLKAGEIYIDVLLKFIK